MPLHAGDCATIAANAATLVNEKTVLHYNFPWYFSTWTKLVAFAGVTQLSKSPPSKVDGAAPKSTPDPSGIYLPPWRITTKPGIILEVT